MGMHWAGYWGAPWGAWGWVFPLIGLLFMVVMVFACVRMMGGMAGGGCMMAGAGHTRRRTVGQERRGSFPELPTASGRRAAG